MKKIMCLGGGTMEDIRPHLSLCAPAFGTISKQIAKQISKQISAKDYEISFGQTAMCGEAQWNDDYYTRDIGRTNTEVADWIQKNIIEDLDVKIVFLSVAFCDFSGNVLDVDNSSTWSGKDQPRLHTAFGGQRVLLTPSEKIIGKIRKDRKDIFLVGFKTTASATEEDMFEMGLQLLKTNSCNLVVVNDVQTKQNMIVTPELTTYSHTKNRVELVENLVEMSLLRASNTFTRTIVMDGDFQRWSDVPSTLKKVVDWCVDNGAYEAFNNVTVGHFGYKAESNVIMSSRRKRNFNYFSNKDLVKVVFSKNQQTAFGAKPSAGARSQYIVLSKFDDLDCIVHFHCPLKPTSKIPQVNAQRPQMPFECGSHECGKNTADGLVRVNKNLAVVMLDKHGPNIVFSRNARPEMIISFIEENFDLTSRTT